MNILWIISSGWKEGGAESYLVMLRPVLERMGHTVRILSSDARPDLPHFSDVEYDAHESFLAPLFHTFNPSAYRTLRRELREFRPDIVHVHTLGHGSPALLLPLLPVPTVLTVHGPEGFVKQLRAWCFPPSCFRGDMHTRQRLTLRGQVRMLYYRTVMDLLYAVGLRAVDTYIAPSSYIMRVLQAQGIHPVHIANGIELFSPVPFPHDGDAPEIAYVGRLETLKGVDILLRAMPLVLRDVPGARLHICGTGSQLQALEQQTHELGIAHAVSFAGALSRENVARAYARASVCVVPSRAIEAFGLVGIEAMSIGRPVVASRVGGIGDWLEDGVTGIAVPPNDEAALANAIISLLTDRQMARTMGERARQRALAYSIERHAGELLAAYNATITKRRR